MDISHIRTVEQMQDFLNKNKDEKIKLSAKSKKELYDWISKVLLQVKYRKLTKKRKRIVRKFLKKTTKYSGIQLKRLIGKYRKGKLKWNKWQKSEFTRSYERRDIELLHWVDSQHRLSGQATKKILQREFHTFNNENFRKLANISVSHIYNLRKTKIYLHFGIVFTKTKSVVSNIGVRKKPRPNGKPGYLRVDSVHQGDKNKQKGVYYINIVDEVTQYEFVFCVPAISEKYMKLVLQLLKRFCPLIIINFHSDNGSEYINKVVADILNKLHIKQTKSRPRRSNDNALAETKNGSIIRKQFGYIHIPATEENANLINSFCIKHLNPYLNFHRPCGFASIRTDKKGKEKKVYKQEDYQTPYEKLKSLPNAKQYLKKGVSFKQLDQEAYKYSDTEFAVQMNKAKEKTFSMLKL